MNFDIDKNRKIIIIALAVLFILFLLIRIIIVSTVKDESKTEEVTNSTEISNTVTNQEKIKKLKKLSESERIRTYLGEYFKFLEKKDYESAYKLLYADFKQNYFPTLEKYKEYLEKTNYPELIAINYKNIETQGYYYIVTLDITNFDPNAINSESTIKEDTKFVIKENDYDNFYLSFQL